MNEAPRTLFDRIWESHVVAQEAGAPVVLYVDLHLVHEVTSPQAFSGLRARGLKVRRPDLTGHLQPLGRVGQIHAVQANVRHRPSVAAAVRGSDVVINLVGVLFESGRRL